ncbi:FecR domain-containing protein [Pseudorhodoferax sp.]|uniref:FecR domain-containing protein n=1 Tax=Pseudorhodoferax sp. TaxID=1993553 RepID=UPI0039E429F2
MSVSTTSADSGRGPPMAGGQPIREAVADQAAQWLTVMMSGEASDDERRRWQRWRAAHPDHERAWQHVEAVVGKFKAMAPHAAYNALSAYADGHPGRRPGSRRKALRALLWTGGMLGGAGLLASRTQTWQQLAADFSTGTGEQRRLTLDDGTAVTLNTATAIDVRFDGRQRLVRLAAGEVLVVTGHGTAAVADSRPFVVETAEGRIRALGTRFTVRRLAGSTQVAVLESAVEITPCGGSAPRVLRAGERATFRGDAVGAPEALGAEADAWTRGQLLADGMRLGDFVTEVGRYRPGVLRCAPEVAGLRFSGVFPLQNTDHILSALPRVLPVQVRWRTRYWVTVEAAAR